MKAASIQPQIRLCDRKENLRRSLALAAEAAEEGAELLVFPELFLTGFCYQQDSSDGQPYPSLDPLRSFVAEHGCLIVGSLVDGRLNRGFCLEEAGIGFQDKIHPFGPEKDHFDGGRSISPVKTSKGRIGLSICYDLRFPEVARSLALSGADLLVTIGEFPASRGGCLGDPLPGPGDRKPDPPYSLQRRRPRALRQIRHHRPLGEGDRRDGGRGGLDPRRDRSG